MRRFYLVLDKDTKEVYPLCELYPLKSYTDNKFKLWSSTFLKYNSINFKPQRAFVFTCMRVCLYLLHLQYIIHYQYALTEDAITSYVYIHNQIGLYVLRILDI